MYIAHPFIVLVSGASCLTLGISDYGKQEKKSKGLIFQPMGNSVRDMGQRKNKGKYNKICIMLQV